MLVHMGRERFRSLAKSEGVEQISESLRPRQRRYLRDERERYRVNPLRQFPKHGSNIVQSSGMARIADEV